MLDDMMLGLVLLASVCMAFNFKQLTVSPTSSTIGISTQYYILFERYTNNANIQTAWQTSLVPSGSTITLTFPSQYTLTPAPSCLSVVISNVAASSFSCSTTGNTVTVTGAITSNLAINTVEITLNNVVNPVPAVFTGQFQGTIGTDVAVPNGGGVQLTAASFDSCRITFDLAYVNQTSTMVVTLDPKNGLDSTSSILISVPRHYTNDIVATSQLPITSSMSCVNYSSGVAVAPNCVGNNVYFSITASNLLTAATSSSFAFGVKQMVSPPTLQASDSFTITSYSGTSAIDTCTVYATSLLPNVFLNLVISPIQTMIVNTDLIGLKIDMTLADFVNTNDDFQVIFPSQIVPTFVNVTGSSPLNSSTSTVAGQTLTVYHRRIERLYNKGAVYTLNFYKIKAPPSTKTTNPITVKIIRNGADKMIGYGTIRAIASTLTGTVSATLSTVNKVTTYKLNIVLNDALTSSGMVKIVFPSTITPTLLTGCATLVGNNVVSSPNCAYDSVGRTMTISSMNSSTSSITIQTLKFTILGVQNAPSIGPSGSFSIASYYTTDINDLVSQGTIAGITATLDTLDPSRVSVVPSSYIVSDTLVTYSLNFVNGNNLPQSGYCQITIPSGVILMLGSISSYCKLSINSSAYFSTACSGTAITGGYYVNFTSIAQSSSLPAGTNISLRIQTLFTNPADTSIISSFTVKTYHSDTFGIEQLTTGISVQMSTPSPFTSIAVSRSSNLNSDSTPTYTFKLKQIPSLPANSKLIITFPSILAFSNPISCTTLPPVSALNCSQTASSVSVELANAVSSGVEFGVAVSSIINPPSFAPLTALFSFATKSSDGILSYASGSANSNLQNNLPSSFAQLAGSFSQRIYGEATNLLITVTPSSRMTPSYMLITFPSSYAIPTSLSCASWTCTAMSTYVIKVTGITSTSQISFTVTGMNAPTTATTDVITVTSFDSSDFKIDENNSSLSFAAACTLPCRTCALTNTSSCLTCYTNTLISTSVYFYASHSTCYTSCPSGTYANAYTCLDCSLTCQTCIGTATNCTSCWANSTYPYLYMSGSTGSCRTLCPIYFYPDTSSSPVTCVPCVGRCSTCLNSTQCLSCVSPYYFYNSSCVTSCPSGTMIANNISQTCDPCSTQCATCAGTVDTCLTCSGSAAMYNSTCVSVCPGTLVIFNGSCTVCSSVCATCYVNYDNCTSCNTGSSLPYLYGSTCLATCPELYYNSLANGLCKLCSSLNIGCNNCTSTSTCGTCNWDQGYVFWNSRCYLVTPAGYYNSTGYALPCDIPTYDCATCVNQAFNCTACINRNLEGNACVSQCTAGLVPINKVCVACTPNCRTCSNIQTNCTSCISGLPTPVFLSNYQCVTICPNYTYANLSTSECTSCFSPCEMCTSISQCTSCQLGFYLSNSSCLNPCPYGYFGLNRVCQLCTFPCAACSLSLTVCIACASTYYLVTATSTCTQNCPSGLYPNDAFGNCTGCTPPCGTCSTSASTCTSCLNGLILFNSSCGSSCPDGYYLLNSQCNPCNQNCTRCSSSSVCLSCVFGLLMYSGTCVSACPSTFPVSTTGTCSACSDTNCITCNSLDQCSQCNYPTLLLSGHCLTACPTDYVSNGTVCNYSPVNNSNSSNSSSNSTSNSTLNQTLSSSNLFPVPFTIAACFIGIACIMSKFQHSYTFVSGSLYSLWSPLEWGALGVGAYLYYQTNKTTLAFTVQYIEALVFAAAVAFMYLLNLLALFMQNCYLRNELAFRRWTEKQGSNSCFYVFASIFGLLVTHKFKNILFCKFFGFEMFKAKLDSLQSFRVFNALSFLSFLPSGAILFATSFMIYRHHLADQELMAYIDILVLTLACIVLAILNSRKAEDFFEEKDEQGVVINKRIIQSDSIMQEAIVPFIEEEHQDRGNIGKHNYETERKFKSFMQTISDEASSYHYIEPTKEMQNVSIQAAPVLQDYSRINFYNDEEVSDLSMFKKVDKSINMTKQLNANEVSIQNNLSIFDMDEASVQNSPQQEDISVQHQLDVKDISLQNVVNVDDQAIQMSRHDEDHSIQAAVLVNNASIQYSAKPVFEDISQDFASSEGQNQLDQHQQSLEQEPAENPQGLKAELELDVDEKIRQRQDQLERQQQHERERKKMEMVKKFHREQQQKPYPKQREHEPSVDNVNRHYDNQNSRLDGSSMMDSNANIIVHFKNKRAKQQQQPGDQQQKGRAQSAKTQKEFIELLQGNKKQTDPELDSEQSMSFNVTRDLEDANKRPKNVVYEEQDKVVDDAGEDLMEPEMQNRTRGMYILQNNSNEEVPEGIEKSRSTNFLSTNGRRPPLPNRTNSNNMLEDTMNMQNSVDQDYEEIVHHPIKAFSKPVAHSNYREEDIDYDPKTNLTHLLEKKRKFPISASNHGRFPQSGSQQQPNTREAKQNPLPLPRIERLNSQESQENSERLYKLNSRKALIEDRKLEFEDQQKIEFNSELDEFGKLPKLQNSQSLKKVKSQSRINQRDSLEKPIHRQLLSGDRFVDRTSKFLERQQRKAENTKKKIQEMEVMLERPNVNSSKGYLKQTHSSQDKKKKSELEKVYMNNPFDKRGV